MGQARWRSRGTFRGALLVIALVALSAVWREAARSQAESLREADRRAAALVAGYLTAVAPGSTTTGERADAKLLSAAGALAGASFWRGGLQVWLGHTPLLPSDTSGTDAAVATLVAPDGAVRGAVAVWASVPSAGDLMLVTVSGTFALLAVVMAGLVGSHSVHGRTGLIAAIVLVVVVGVAGQVRGLATADRAATESGLLRTRRVLEITSVPTRIPDTTLARIAPALRITPLPRSLVGRDSVVQHDSTGAWVVAWGSGGQAWLVLDAGTAGTHGPIHGGIVLWGLVAILATLAAAALPPSVGYFTTSRPDPRASP